MREDAISRCTDCEAVELATVQDRGASQLLPIPRLALAGFPDGRAPRELTRRRLMQLGAAGVSAVSICPYSIVTLVRMPSRWAMRWMSR